MKMLASTSPTSPHPDTPDGSGNTDGRVSFRNNKNENTIPG